MGEYLEVDRERATPTRAPRIEICRVEGRLLVDARVAHDYVEAAEARDHLGDKRSALRRLRDVGAD